MPDQHPLVQAITPLIERLNAELIPPADAQANDVPLHWDGQPVIAIRLPQPPAPTTTPATSTAAPATPASTSAAAGAATVPAPTSTAPTSTAPTSTAPTSTAPTSTAPTSTAPTSTAPTSTAPTSTAPTSTAPTDAAPAAPASTDPDPAAVGGAPAAGAGVQKLLADVAAELGGPLRELSRHDKQRAVLLLEARGAFEYRKSAEIVAEALGVTRFTVYNYLNRAR